MKIDGLFVERLGQDPEDEVLLSGIIGIASGLDIYVLAEEVETSDQLARLSSLGCDLAQGNYFSGPLSGEAAGELLAMYDR